MAAGPPVTRLSSTKEFQLPQSGHFPCHLGTSQPHWVQTNTVFVLLFTAIFLLLLKGGSSLPYWFPSATMMLVWVSAASSQRRKVS